MPLKRIGELHVVCRRLCKACALLRVALPVVLASLWFVGLFIAWLLLFLVFLEVCFILVLGGLGVVAAVQSLLALMENASL